LGIESVAWRGKSAEVPRRNEEAKKSIEKIKRREKRRAR